MDGRRCSFFALALSLGLSGCLPSQMKTTTVQAPAPPLDKGDLDETKSLNPFAAKPKREPKLELAMAIYREQKALGFVCYPFLYIPAISRGFFPYSLR